MSLKLKFASNHNRPSTGDESEDKSGPRSSEATHSKHTLTYYGHTNTHEHTRTLIYIIIKMSVSVYTLEWRVKSEEREATKK